MNIETIAIIFLCIIFWVLTFLWACTERSKKKELLELLDGCPINNLTLYRVAGKLNLLKAKSELARIIK